MSYRHIFENSKDGKCPRCGSEAEEHRNNSRSILNGWFCSNKNCEYSFNSRLATMNKMDSEKKCYIATCVYGSYNCQEVWTLRRYRDRKLLNSWFGRQFIRIYYAISPKIVKLLGNKKWFNSFWKPILNKFVRNLQNNGIDNSPYTDV